MTGVQRSTDHLSLKVFIPFLSPRCSIAPSRQTTSTTSRFRSLYSVWTSWDWEDGRLTSEDDVLYYGKGTPIQPTRSWTSTLAHRRCLPIPTSVARKVKDPLHRRPGITSHAQGTSYSTKLLPVRDFPKLVPPLC